MIEIRPQMECARCTHAHVLHGSRGGCSGALRCDCNAFAIGATTATTTKPIERGAILTLIYPPMSVGGIASPFDRITLKVDRVVWDDLDHVTLSTSEAPPAKPTIESVTADVATLKVDLEKIKAAVDKLARSWIHRR